VGWLPLFLADKGWPVFRARRMSMLIYACCATPVVSRHKHPGRVQYVVQRADGRTGSPQRTSVERQHLHHRQRYVPAPHSTVRFCPGFGGPAPGTLGAVIISQIGRLSVRLLPEDSGIYKTGYFIMFVISGSAYLCAWFVMRRWFLK
jgi:ACS family hexuronate transporter-like MFS transporter